MIAKEKVGSILIGERDFGALDRLMQLIAEVRLDQVRQRSYLGGFEGSNARCAQHLAHCPRTQKRGGMPVLKPHIDPVRHRDQSLITGFLERAGPEVRRYQVPDQPRVEGISSEANAAGGE